MKSGKETAVLVGFIGLAAWIAYRASKGLRILPAFISDAVAGVAEQVAGGWQETAEVGRELANAPATQAPSAFEQAVAVVARAAGAESPPELVSRPDLPADPQASGPFLGAPRNALLVAGKVRFPVASTDLRTQLASDVFDVDAALENQAGEPRTGELVLVVREQNILGNWAEQSVSGGKVTLAPREFRQVTVRAPNVVGRPISPLASNVRLRFAGYTLDSVDFHRSYSLF